MISLYFEASSMIFWDFTLGHLINSIYFQFVLTFVTTTMFLKKMPFWALWPDI